MQSQAKKLESSVGPVSPTQLYNTLPAVIPAKAGIQVKKTGFRVKSGMTELRKVIIETVLHIVSDWL